MEIILSLIFALVTFTIIVILGQITGKIAANKGYYKEKIKILEERLEASDKTYAQLNFRIQQLEMKINDTSFEDWYYKRHKEYKGKGIIEQIEPDRFDYEHTNIAQKDFACDPWANSFHGDVIIASYIKLKEILGNPEREYNFDHQKQHYEFKKFTDKEVPFSLYDWKIPAFAPNENVEWHIATHTPDESKKVLEYLNTLLKDDKQSLCNEKSHT